MSEGHPEAGADEERDIDFEDITDDEEVELNLPRAGAIERDLLGEDVRDLPGATASGASVTKQEELYPLEPPGSGGGSYRWHGWLRDEWWRDESFAPKVSTASAGPTECGGSDTPEERY